MNISVSKLLEKRKDEPTCGQMFLIRQELDRVKDWPEKEWRWHMLIFMWRLGVTPQGVERALEVPDCGPDS